VPVNVLAVRLGYRTGPGDLGTLGPASGLCAGLGVRAGSFDLDYAFTPYGKLGMAHRIGLQVRYVRSGSSTLKVKVISAKTNDPLPADLVFDGVSRSAVVTDVYGEYLAERLPSGMLVVRAARAGYLPQIETVYVRQLDRDQHVTIALQSVEDGGVWGSLVDAATGKPIGGTVVYDGPLRDTLEIDSLRGSFALKSLASGTYVFHATGPTPEYVAQTCTLEVKTGRLIQHDFRLATPPKPMMFPGVFFSIGKADVMAEFGPTIESVARALKDNPRMEIEIAGHADGYELFSPAFASRQALSQARADAVKELLVRRFGVNPARLTARGYAEFRALAPSDLPEGRAKNRSVEFIVTRQ
jgi:outer membrane protein OmpA-like peptidoglycan-associated protein